MLIPKKWFVLWLTGLSGSGKSTLADNLNFRLKKENYHKIERLDGDIVREKLTKDLWFSQQDRALNLERVCFVAKLLSRNGVGVIASFISPYEQDRAIIKQETTNFIEVYVATPLEICEQRDIKWLYQKARKGEIKNFTGISDPYQEPTSPDLKILTYDESIEESVNQIYNYLKENYYL